MHVLYKYTLLEVVKNSKLIHDDDDDGVRTIPLREEQMHCPINLPRETGAA